MSLARTYCIAMTGAKSLIFEDDIFCWIILILSLYDLWTHIYDGYEELELADGNAWYIVVNYFNNNYRINYVFYNKN
jgi:hypothetical protein